MSEESKDRKHLNDEEIINLVRAAKKPGMRFTVDLYLLDYIKHCFLEDGQLQGNIDKLQLVLKHVDEPAAKSAVEEVISSLKCVQSEYKEYLADMRAMAAEGDAASRNE
ncbi:hypothetical protein [Hufsiella ginkgonis]|uniref:Uncharacterized protein n=1 Tax=Hufsiella ginkgonis TaxID=2695274 RepID=A0A7K1XTH5_9SPHI|nr:hypothetical protein [Hufsiella ginkgonis]MXV14262.1 hypothetical protein [Hufsiella ginkgonis]